MSTQFSARRDHALFKRYPLDAQVAINGETLTSPYQIYDGTMLLIGGTVDAGVASRLLTKEGLTPMRDDAGRVLAAVWVCDFTDANLGPHHELQISLFASFQPTAPVDSHPFALIRALLLNPDMRMVCHGLWNSTERVVGYNRAHLRLNAHVTRSVVERGDDRWSFRFDEEGGGPILDGAVDVAAAPSPAVMWNLLRHIGWRGFWRTIRSPIIQTPVVNTRSAFSDETLVANTGARSDRQVLRLFGPQDHVRIHHPLYAPLDFAPTFVQRNEGVRFVYLRPQSDADYRAEMLGR